MTDNISLRNALYALLISVLCNPVHAIDLSDMVADSISAHPQVKEKVHVYRQVIRDQSIAQSGWRPSVDLQASTGFYDTESPATGNQSIDYDSSQMELSVTQNLFNGYDTTHQIEQTRARARSALLDLYDTADNIALDAIQAYFDVQPISPPYILASYRYLNSRPTILLSTAAWRVKFFSAVPILFPTRMVRAFSWYVLNQQKTI